MRLNGIHLGGLALCVLAVTTTARARADEPPRTVAHGPPVRVAMIPGVDARSADQVRGAGLEEVQANLPDPDKLAEWFQGHGGAILGAGTMGVAPLGSVAGGDKGAFHESHLPGAGVFGDIGMLFLRRWGIKARGGLVQHLKGSGGIDSASSSQVGVSALYLFKPEEKSPYLELGIVRSAYAARASVPTGVAERSSASLDGRLGLGYMVLTKGVPALQGQQFMYSPWVTADFGRFGDMTQTLNGVETTTSYGSNTAWHMVLSAGITIAYHKKIHALVGPVPTQVRPDDADGDMILDPHDRCPTEREDYFPPDPRDGCPSEDWDQDGIPNTEDACPKVRGVRADDPKVNGCPAPPPPPEVLPLPKAEIGETMIVLREQVLFDVASKTINDRSLPLVDEIAALLTKNPRAELVEIQGHADDIGTPEENLSLTQARARLMREALIARGVEPARLVAVGYGEYCPVEPNAPSRAGNDKNRRVEFRILRAPKGPTGVATACDEAKRHGIKGTDPKVKGASK